MPESNPDQRLNSAIERLYEDERLRSSLTDEESETLLKWAEGRLEEAARKSESSSGVGDPAAAFDDAAQRIRAAVREVNDLAGEKDRLSEDEFRGRVQALLATPGGTAPALSPLAEGLVKNRKRISNAELIDGLTTLLSQSRRSPGGSGRRRRSSPAPWLLLGVILLVAAAVVVLLLAPGVMRRGGPIAAPSPVPEKAGWYQVYFTAPKYPDRQADHHGSLDEKLAAFIGEASTSVDMAIYQLDLENVTKAVLDAKARGATVRVVTGTDIMEDSKESPSFKRLQSAGITVVAGNPNAIMHDKFVVVDGKAVWTGSWNFTDNDTYRYNNNGMLIRSPELARNYTATFEKMWKDKKFGAQRKPGGTTPRLTIEGVPVENYFAPEDDVAEKIVARVKGAQKAIDFMAFSFTDDDIGDEVMARSKAGANVRGVFENTGSETRFSEYGRMKDAGLDVLQDGNPYLMHHKVFVIDGKTVVMGSFNFSQNAETSNDENLLIVDDPAMAGQFEAEFDRVYAQAKSPPAKK